MPKALRCDKRPLPPIHTAHNVIVFTDEDKTAAFADRPENQCQTNIESDADDETVENLREEEPDVDELIRDTNPDEVRIVIRSLKPKKAPGADQILNKALENLSEAAIVALTGIINAMFKFRFFAGKWKQANVIFIPKPGKNQFFPQNHRPISLLSSVGKIAEKSFGNGLPRS